MTINIMGWDLLFCNWSQLPLWSAAWGQSVARWMESQTHTSTRGTCCLVHGYL